MNQKLLFFYIKSHYPYKNIKSLKDVSKNDKMIFTKNLIGEIAKNNEEDIKRQIRNKSRIVCGFEADL